MGDKKKKLEKIVIDGADTSEMKFPKLQELALTLRTKLDTARRERNLLQAQCAQMRTAWEMTKLKLQDSKYKIKATAMNRDKMEVEVCSQTIKEMNELKKYMSFNLNERLNNMKAETQDMLKDIEAKWDETTLQHLLAEKTRLKLLTEVESEESNKKILECQQQMDQDVFDFVDKLESETNAVIDAQLNNLRKYLYNTQMISDTAFFRTQEEYNRIIRELSENGTKNTGMMREFYKRITEDDIIIIMVLEKQVRKLKKIVKKKQVMCKKINEQSATIESSKGELEINLRRAERKMKLYDTNTLSLDRANYLSGKLGEKIETCSRDLKEMRGREAELSERVKQMEEHVNQFHEVFETRRREVFEPLKHKAHVLRSLIRRDKDRIKRVLPGLPAQWRNTVGPWLNTCDVLAADCMSHLVFDLAKLCNTHDSLVQFVENSLASLNITHPYKLSFKRINFDALSYGLGPNGQLISSYPL